MFKSPVLFLDTLCLPFWDPKAQGYLFDYEATFPHPFFLYYHWYRALEHRSYHRFCFECNYNACITHCQAQISALPSALHIMSLCPPKFCSFRQNIFGEENSKEVKNIIPTKSLLCSEIALQCTTYSYTGIWKWNRLAFNRHKHHASIKCLFNQSKYNFRIERKERIKTSIKYNYKSRRDYL